MEKKKILLIAAACLVLTAMATAWSLGDSISISRFKEVDIDAHDFEMTPTANEIVKYDTGHTELKIGFSYLTFEQNNLSEYDLVELGSTVTMQLIEYNNCRESGKFQKDCIAELKARAIEKIINYRENVRTYLKDEQKSNYASELTAESIKITPEEINAAQSPASIN